MRLTLLVLAGVVFLQAETRYQKAPDNVRQILDSAATPTLIVSPARSHVLLAQPLRYPPISQLAEPMLRLAGVRINPKTNGLHNSIAFVKLTLKKLPEGGDMEIALPAGVKPGAPRWNRDGSLFAFSGTTSNGVELWIGATATGRARRMDGIHLNTILGGGPNSTAAGGFEWMDDGRTLLAQSVPSSRNPPPRETGVPPGPHVQETLGKAGPVPTYEDMLQTPHDEDLFEYYATSQLVWVDAATGKVTPVGSPAVYSNVHPSPDGKHLLAIKVKRPYSYVHPYPAFPKDIEILDPAGKRERLVASLALAERVPIEGVPVGPRSPAWQPSAPATVVWTEALDGGNPKEKATYRDRIVALRAPFQGDPVEVAKLEQRARGLQMAEKVSLAMASDYERNRRWLRTFLIDFDKPGEPPRELWSRNVQDRYKDPGTPMSASNSRRGGMLVDGDFVILRGLGASPQGSRPFLDRYNLKTGKTERLFQCDESSYEEVEALLDDKGARFITRRESPTDPPNYFMRGGGAMTALTKIPDPAPVLRGVEQRLVTYKRADGVALSFTLYLPPGYKPGTRLPTVLWAYPREYNDADTGSQITGSTKRFTTIAGMSHLFFLLKGYAILDDAAMPVIGDPETVNNTYIEQVVADAKAAIDKAVEIGVTDRDRVGVGGHSYGAFMTANLLAHSNLFKAGIARSGAYNRTLTPFGFQTERRTLWEATETYLKMSPFMNAAKIKTPILLIHGEADDNTGTFPVQSERMYAAIRGNGGTVRLVMLPYEAHGYRARESIEHTLWEMFAWFDKYVKGSS